MKINRLEKVLIATGIVSAISSLVLTANDSDPKYIAATMGVATLASIGLVLKNAYHYTFPLRNNNYNKK